MNSTEQEIKKVVYVDETTESTDPINTEHSVDTEQPIQTTDQLLFGTNVPVDVIEEEIVEEKNTLVEEKSESEDVDDIIGGGYESDGNLSETSSVSTNQILSIDPLYLRLTKFLQTDDGTSVAQTLKDIHKELLSLNTALSNTNIRS